MGIVLCVRPEWVVPLKLEGVALTLVLLTPAVDRSQEHMMLVVVDHIQEHMKLVVVVGHIQEHMMLVDIPLEGAVDIGIPLEGAADIGIPLEGAVDMGNLLEGAVDIRKEGGPLVQVEWIAVELLEPKKCQNSKK